MAVSVNGRRSTPIGGNCASVTAKMCSVKGLDRYVEVRAYGAEKTRAVSGGADSFRLVQTRSVRGLAVSVMVSHVVEATLITNQVLAASV